MTVLAITRASLLRILRDRTALFFMIVLPVMVILIIGVTVGGVSKLRVGVVDLGSGAAGHDVTAALSRSPALDVRHYPTMAAATTAVARGEAGAAVLLPAGMDAALRAGSTVDIGVMAEQANSTQQAALTAVRSVVATQGGQVQAAHFATVQGSGGFDENLVRAASLRHQIPQATIAAQQVDANRNVLPQGFSYSAPTMLVLFVFLNALAGGAAIIETRRLGIYERMATAPIRTSTIVAGETLTYLSIALMQAGLIVFVGAVVFGVSWGSPMAAATLIAVWALVGASAGMVAGTLFRTPEQATAVGPVVGIGLAMLGGCMWPLAIVSNLMRQIGHATPQAWAVDAWTALISRNGTLASIAPQLAVLAAFAAVLLTVATVRLRRVIVA